MSVTTPTKEYGGMSLISDDENEVTPICWEPFNDAIVEVKPETFT